MKCKLKDFCTVINGRAYSQKELLDKGKYRVLRVGNFFSSDRWYFSDLELPAEKYCNKGDLLFAWACSFGPRIWNGEDRTIFHYHIWKLDIDSDIVDKMYLFYLLKISVDSMTAGTHGSVMMHITKSDMENFEFDIPSLDVQKKIAAILSALDEKIAINREINENLERQAMAMFKKWFVDNPDVISWKEGTFSDLIEKTISGDWGKDSPFGNNTEMVYCIRGADIPEVRAGNKGKMPTRYILPKNYAAKQLVDGDIVVEISGGSPTQSTGRAAAVSNALLARYDKGMVCTNFCKALKPRAGYSMYVYYYWQYLYDRNIFFSYENGTTGIKNLDINGFIETEPITIAPENLVEKFDAVCQTVFSKIYANGMENEQLALVRDTLLPKLMSGEIDVSAVQR